MPINVKKKEYISVHKDKGAIYAGSHGKSLDAGLISYNNGHEWDDHSRAGNKASFDNSESVKIAIGKMTFLVSLHHGFSSEDDGVGKSGKELTSSSLGIRPDWGIDRYSEGYSDLESKSRELYASKKQSAMDIAVVKAVNRALSDGVLSDDEKKQIEVVGKKIMDALDDKKITTVEAQTIANLSNNIAKGAVATGFGKGQPSKGFAQVG